MRQTQHRREFHTSKPDAIAQENHLAGGESSRCKELQQVECGISERRNSNPHQLLKARTDITIIPYAQDAVIALS